MVLILMFLSPYIDTLSGDLHDSKRLTFRCAILGLLSGATNENTAGAAILFCMLTILITVFRTKGRWSALIGSAPRGCERVPVWMIAGFVGALVGFCFMLSAPGNFLRVERVGDILFSVRLYNLSLYAQKLYLVPAVIYAGLLMLSIHVYRKEVVQKSLVSILFVLCGCAAGFVMLFTPAFPERVFFGGVTLMIAAVLYQGKVLLNSFSKTSLLLTPVLGVLMVAFAFSITLSAAHLHAIKEAHNERIAFIEEQRALGELDVVVRRLNPSTIRSALSTLGDMGEDSTRWKNRSLARHYELDSIWTEGTLNLP
jgi:hypothetical protein